MFLFALKKWFYEVWDSMLRILLINCLLLVITAFFTYLQTLFVGIGTLLVQGMIITSVIVAFFLIITSLIVASNTYLMEHNWKTSVTKSRLHSIVRSSIKPGFAFGGIMVLVLLLSFVSLQFYASFGGFLAPLVIGLLLSVLFLYVLSAQYTLPMYRLQENTIKRSLKKSFLIALDNPGFSILLLITALILLTLSMFTAFLFPGIAGVSYLFCCATKLRLLKYDAENPRKPDWDILLAEERKRVGTRSFISFIFPWK